MFSLFHDVAKDSPHFGFTNITTPCLSPTLVVCADPDHTLFLDTEHPTEFGHAFFAVAVEASLSHTDDVNLRHWLAAWERLLWRSMQRGAERLQTFL